MLNQACQTNPTQRKATVLPHSSCTGLAARIADLLTGVFNMELTLGQYHCPGGLAWNGSFLNNLRYHNGLGKVDMVMTCEPLLTTLDGGFYSNKQSWMYATRRPNGTQVRYLTDVCHMLLAA